jgi:UDP-N-acetylglucosamine 2-epimerase (non-hydrolysing)
VIVAVFGTTGELIKLAPVLRRLDQRCLAYVTMSTNQQVTQIPEFQRDLGLRPTDVELASGHRGNDLERRADIPSWLATVTRSFLRHRTSLGRRLSMAAGTHVLIVHGDTMTTVLGAVMGRVMRLQVAHLEAGMRSGDWRNPFPEELDRRVAGRLASIHYAGTDREVRNLGNGRGEVIRIGANTVLDSIQLVPEGLDVARETLGALTPESRFGLVSLHRSELLGNGPRLEAILTEVSRTALDYPLFFVDHPVTVHALRAHGLDHCLRNLIRIPRLRYTAFIQLLRGSEFLLTDSGGCQEECYYLDVPCLVHRLVTERGEGLGANVVMSRYDLSIVREFLRHPERWRMGSRPRLASPSDVVVDDLVHRGVWGNA